MLSASQLNLFLFCPRLVFLEAVLGCEGSNIPSEEGRLLHDKLADREVYVESEALGLCGKVDVLEKEEVPIEYKRGKPQEKNTPWPGHAVQLCALGMMLEENREGPVPFGYIWYNQVRQRVKVEFTETLRQETRAAIQNLQNVLASDRLPDPISNRNACLGCNQYRNCLPDEIQQTLAPEDSRTILSPHIEGQPVYVDRPGAKLSVKQGSLEISIPDEPEKIRIGLPQINQVVVCQPANLTSSFLEACAKQRIPVALLDFSGRWQGQLQGPINRNTLTRFKQYELLGNPQVCLVLTQSLLKAKLTNQRVWLRRHLNSDHPKTLTISRLLKRVDELDNLQQLLGLEGEAAKALYEGFSQMLSENQSIEWLGRKKRPSPDPLNSLLSFGYSILMQQVVTGCYLAGLDPYYGFYHGLKQGKPSLALDLMEIYRTPVVDATVLGFINRGQCTSNDFEITEDKCFLKPAARKAFTSALFERLRSTMKHPVFGYQTTYQRAIHVEARLFSYALLSGLDLWRPYTWR